MSGKESNRKTKERLSRLPGSGGRHRAPPAPRAAADGRVAPPHRRRACPPRLLSVGDWRRLLAAVGGCWRLLAAAGGRLHFFGNLALDLMKSRRSIFSEVALYEDDISRIPPERHRRAEEIVYSIKLHASVDVYDMP